LSQNPAAPQTGRILFVPDERLSRERSQIVNRTLLRLKSLAPLEILSQKQINEDQLLERIKALHPALVLLPWKLALEWTRADAFYGSKRLRGPVVAGYIGEPLVPEQIDLPVNRSRFSLIDFHRLSPEESIPLLLTLADDSRRGGISALHAVQLVQAPLPPLWDLPWKAGESAGNTLDRILNHPELPVSGWAGRIPQLRRCVLALWTLIHEEGPGAGKLAQAQATAAHTGVAAFQMSFSPSLLTLRLNWELPAWSQRDVLESWWRRPDDLAPDTQAVIQTNCDFLRIQHHEDGARIELVAGFLPSMPSIMNPREVRTLLIEPLEHRFAAEGRGCAEPGAPRPFPEMQTSNDKNRSTPSASVQATPDRRIQDLEKKIAEQARAIERMREGGVGENTEPALRAPDIESLIGAVRDRLEDSVLQIREITRAIREAPYRKLKPEEVMKLRTRLRSVDLRHKTWVSELGAILGKFQKMNFEEPRNESGPDGKKPGEAA
jgi:hypothetical protein